MNRKTKDTGFGMALGAALGTALGVAVGHVGVWLPIGVAIGMLLGMSPRHKEPACPESDPTELSHDAAPRRTS